MADLGRGSRERVRGVGPGYRGCMKTETRLTRRNPTRHDRPHLPTSSPGIRMKGPAGPTAVAHTGRGRSPHSRSSRGADAAGRPPLPPRETPGNLFPRPKHFTTRTRVPAASPLESRSRPLLYPYSFRVKSRPLAPLPLVGVRLRPRTRSEVPHSDSGTPLQVGDTLHPNGHLSSGRNGTTPRPSPDPPPATNPDFKDGRFETHPPLGPGEGCGNLTTALGRMEAPDLHHPLLGQNSFLGLRPELISPRPHEKLGVPLGADGVGGRTGPVKTDLFLS